MPDDIQPLSCLVGLVVMSLRNSGGRRPNARAGVEFQMVRWRVMAAENETAIGSHSRGATETTGNLINCGELQRAATMASRTLRRPVSPSSAVGDLMMSDLLKPDACRVGCPPAAQDGLAGGLSA